MERLTLEDMIKALKCISSRDAEGDCYMDHENFKHMEDDKYKRIVCETGENLRDYISGKEAAGCPYHQNTYGCCFEDGELYWLKDVAELLEELKSYKEAEEQGLLVRLPVPLGSKVYWISTKDKQNPIIFEKIFVLGMLYFWDSTVFATREEAEKKLEKMKNAGML